jgi:transposase-like protein
MIKKKGKKLKTKVLSEKPWHRYDDDFKKRVLKEINDGILGYREASRKYNIHRRNFDEWRKKFSLVNLEV